MNGGDVSQARICTSNSLLSGKESHHNEQRHVSGTSYINCCAFILLARLQLHQSLLFVHIVYFVLTTVQQEMFTAENVSLFSLLPFTRKHFSPVLYKSDLNLNLNQ